MFQNSRFKEECFQLRSGPVAGFTSFTDGLDFILTDDGPDENIRKTDTILEFTKVLREAINEKITDMAFYERP